MDKSYIIRIYKQENGTTSGIVVDVEKSKRARFDSANQLWSLITRDTKQHEISVIESNANIRRIKNGKNV
jgi:hypothetical protein